MHPYLKSGHNSFVLVPRSAKNGNFIAFRRLGLILIHETAVLHHFNPHQEAAIK